jgi:DNA-binding LacI/PurR family transcriptional regulator
VAGQWIRKYGVPFVAFAVYSPYMVALDEAAMTELAIKRLKEEGCQRIGLWVSSVSYVKNKVYRDVGRYVRFRELLTRYDLPFYPELVRDYFSLAVSTTQEETLTYQEQGYLQAIGVFGDANIPKPDGIFVTDDMMTDGVIAAFQALGLSIGEDVKVATHGNQGSMMSFNYIKGLTVIEFDPDDIVQAMFQMLDLLLVGEVPEQPFSFIKPKYRQPKW